MTKPKKAKAQTISAQVRARYGKEEMQQERKLMAAESATAKEAANIANTPLAHLAFVRALSDAVNGLDQFLSRLPNTDSIAITTAVLTTPEGDFDVTIRLHEINSAGFNILATVAGKPLGTPKEN